MMIIMRYEKGRKSATRERIVHTAAGEFRRKGLGGIGVADVMKRSGLTHGGFYSHFPSRDALVREAVTVVFPQNDLTGFADGPRAFERLVRHYLRPDHCTQPEFGCPLAAFIGEIPRQSRAIREDFSIRIERLFTFVERALPLHLTGTRRRQTAQAVASLCVGTLQMARASTDPKTARQILRSGIQAALTLAQR